MVSSRALDSQVFRRVSNEYGLYSGESRRVGNEYGSYSFDQGEWVTNILGVFEGFLGIFRRFSGVWASG
jgi:hypothetical protein